MKPFIFCEKWGTSIIDMTLTACLFEKALKALESCVKKGGRILFVGTKHQASDLIMQTAQNCGQYYINKRWLGGTITNNLSTISLPLNKLAKMEKDIEAGYVDKLTKRERQQIYKKREKIVTLFSGIKNLNGIPDMLIVIDPKREGIAIKEAKLGNIPVIALADTDTPEPGMITYLVPGNDEGQGAIHYFLQMCEQTINKAMQEAGIQASNLQELAEKKEAGTEPKFSLKESNLSNDQNTDTDLPKDEI
jgi:small subunit ribosomal protein S2